MQRYVLFVVLFCLWATTYGFLPFPEWPFVFPSYFHTHVSVGRLFNILQVSTQMSLAPSHVPLLSRPKLNLLLPSLEHTPHIAVINNVFHLPYFYLYEEKGLPHQ